MTRTCPGHVPGRSFFALPSRAGGVKIACIDIQCQPGGLRMSGDNVMGDHDDQVIEPFGSDRMERLAAKLRALVLYQTPEVCDQHIANELEWAAKEAESLAVTVRSQPKTGCSLPVLHSPC